MIEDLESARATRFFGLLEPRTRGEVLSYLDGDAQVRIVERMPTAEAAELLQLMSHDDRADLVKRLDEDRVEEILPRPGPGRARGHPPAGQLSSPGPPARS